MCTYDFRMLPEFNQSQQRPQDYSACSPAGGTNKREGIRPVGKSNPNLHPQPLEITLIRNPEEGLLLNIADPVTEQEFLRGGTDPAPNNWLCQFDEIRWDPCPASYNSSLGPVCQRSQHSDDPLSCRTVQVQFDDAPMTWRLHKNASICMALKRDTCIFPRRMDYKRSC